MNDDQIRIRIDDDEDLAAAHEASLSTGVDFQQAPDESDGLEEQITVIAGIVIGAGVLAAAKFIADWWEKRRGGLVIDMRPDAADQVHRDRDVPWGHVLIFTADGKDVRVETQDMPEDATERLIAAVLSGVLGTPAELKKKALAGGDTEGAADPDAPGELAPA
ncbi:hypothetical protein [Auraticoccus monumenti]|uniref:Uncharacterized protein n=1 Tax=Auraticoccus monumenti TaxID=675864 RepID=A0A1G7BQ58_9ACTN|nr:hypothetical protein [Auraticoccus monumenti]SDE29209.1 hypothetical protein SAMN04489747_3031 [Auraticoccus monumenti]